MRLLVHALLSWQKKPCLWGEYPEEGMDITWTLYGKEQLYIRRIDLVEHGLSSNLPLDFTFYHFLILPLYNYYLINRWQMVLVLDHCQHIYWALLWWTSPHHSQMKVHFTLTKTSTTCYRIKPSTQQAISSQFCTSHVCNIVTFMSSNSGCSTGKSIGRQMTATAATTTTNQPTLSQLHLQNPELLYRNSC